jgi:hypothetical protein
MIFSPKQLQRKAKLNEGSKFTFKTIKPTGRFRSFDTDTNFIKLDGKQVGNIFVDKSDRNNYIIQLHVKKKDITEDGNPNCVWKNIRLAKKYSSVDEAKEWLNQNITALQSKYELFPIEG